MILLPLSEHIGPENSWTHGKIRCWAEIADDGRARCVQQPMIADDPERYGMASATKWCKVLAARFEMDGRLVPGGIEHEDRFMEIDRFRADFEDQLNMPENAAARAFVDALWTSANPTPIGRGEDE